MEKGAKYNALHKRTGGSSVGIVQSPDMPTQKKLMYGKLRKLEDYCK